MNIPQNLKHIIGSEEIIFITKAKKEHSYTTTISSFIFAFFWNFITLSICYNHFNLKHLNHLKKIKNSTSFIQKLTPSSIILLFFLGIGIYLMLIAIKNYYKKGSYFIGTQTKLIKHCKNKTTLTNWNQFSGNIKIKAKNNFGNISLELKTGKLQYKQKMPSIYIPNTIHIVGIKNVYKIEKKCRKKIEASK